MTINNGFVDGYTFWPSDEVDALFTGKIDYKTFYLEMKKMYERAVSGDFEIGPALEEVVSELPIDKQLELLLAIKARECPGHGKQNKEG